jgi:penicillin-binding protein 1A
VVPFSRISKNLVDAVIAAEDNRFYEHGGVDYMGMARAALKNYKAGKIRQGASTVTQQLARNSFELRARTYERKIIEIYLSKRIEENFSKDKIMEFYLNRVYFGGGLYGCEAAAKGYFGKSAADLSPGEAATLAGILKSPNQLSPWRNPKGAEQERNFVLGRMLEIGKINKANYDDAKLLSFRVRARKSSSRGQSYALDLIRQRLTADLDFDTAASSGYKIYTTIDADLQKTAEESLARELAKVEASPGYANPKMEEWQTARKAQPAPVEGAPAKPEDMPDYLQGAVYALDSKTGGILVLVGGRDYADSQYNRATEGLRPPGTAFTPFVFAAGFAEGIFPGTLVDDSALDNRQVMIGGFTGILGEWGSERADSQYEGLIPARRAVSQGKNAATVRFGLDLGLEKVIEFAKIAGMDSPMRQFPATYLGSSEVTLAQLTVAYTIFPEGGYRPAAPYIITRVEEADGTLIYQATPTRKKVTRGAVAFEVHSFLSDVLEDGTGANAVSEYKLRSFPGGGKTGTAYNFTDAWFVGYDSEITCGVWAGFDKRRTIYRGAFSNKIALPVWSAVMNASLSTHPPQPIARPADIERIEVCKASGLPATRDCFKTEADGLRKRTTFYEFSSGPQTPKGTCFVHGGTGSAAPAVNQRGKVPIAMPATNTSDVKAIPMKAPALIGSEDPFNSTVPRAEPVSGVDPQTGNPIADPNAPPEQPKVMRAERARPVDNASAEPALNLEPPPPLDLR